VIGTAEDLVGMSHRVAFGAQDVECVERRRIGEKQPVDVEQYLAARLVGHDRVAIPNLLKHGAWLGHRLDSSWGFAVGAKQGQVHISAK
jgi:hypothetical protein